MYGIPQYKFPYGALHTLLNSSPLQGQSFGGGGGGRIKKLERLRKSVGTPHFSFVPNF